MKLTLSSLADIGDQLGNFLHHGLNVDETETGGIPVTISRYNTEQIIDRIVIQVRGGLGVTIHTADSGGK